MALEGLENEQQEDVAHLAKLVYVLRSQSLKRERVLWQVLFIATYNQL